MNATGSTSQGQYKRPMTRTWWLRNPRYTLFMIRELTAILILSFVVLYLVQIARLGSGRASYDGFLELMESPLWIALHILFLLGAVLHSATWVLLLVPRAMPEFVFGMRIPQATIAAGGLAAWIVVSAIIVLAFRGL